MNTNRNIPPDLLGKLDELEQTLTRYGTVAIGFSGGVDSTFLAAVCSRCIPANTLLIHLDTPFAGTPEQDSFDREVEKLGLPVVTVKVDTLKDPDIAANPKNRCYHCKKLLFSRLREEAELHGCTAILEGGNADDMQDFRPGMQAIHELGVVSPLADGGWRKDEERQLLRAWGHEVWDLPAGACLATRIACGEPLTFEKLDVVHLCEDYLHSLGLRQVRVRISDGHTTVTAAPEDLALLAQLGKVEMGEMGAIDANPDEANAVEVDGTQEIPEVPLPAHVLDRLRQLGATNLAPVAKPYRHGCFSEP